MVQDNCMKKKLFIGLGIFAALLVAAAFYLNHRNRTLSPPGEASVTTATGLQVDVSYSRPSVRGREVFGDSESALQPYGSYWRLGANEASEITFSETVEISNQKVAPGTYRIYGVPEADAFTFYLNSETDVWGYSEANHDLDVVTYTAERVTTDELTEQHTIDLSEFDGGVTLRVRFEYLDATLPIKNL